MHSRPLSFLGTLILILVASHTFAQNSFIYRVQSDSFEYRGINLIADGANGYYLLGQKSFYTAPTGVPFEGSLTLGTHLSHLNENGEADWQLDFNNAFLSNSLGAFGHQPVNKVYLAEDGGVLIPYTTFVGFAACEIGGARESFKPGLAKIDPDGTIAWGRLLGDAFCGEDRHLGVYESEEEIHYFHSDNGGIRYYRLEQSGQTIDSTLISTPFSISQLLVDPTDGLFGLGLSSNGGFSIYHTNTVGDSLGQFLVPVVPNGYSLQKNFKRWEDGSFSLTHYNASQGLSLLSHLSAEGMLQRRDTLQHLLRDFLPLGQEQWVVLVEKNANPANQPTEISLIDANGKVLNSQSVASFYETPVRMLQSGSDKLTILGTKYCCYLSPQNPLPPAEIIAFTAAFDLPTSISESPQISFRIFPNPSRSKVRLEINTAGSYFVKLVNVHGQVLTKTMVRNGHEFDLSQYADGMYYLSISDRNTGRQEVKSIFVRKN